MARKKKKSSKHTRRGRAKAAASRVAVEKVHSDPKQLELLAQQALDAGNFSRAREGFKRLHRLDPEKFEALLAQTTLRTAEELFEKERRRECRDLLVEFAEFEKISAEDRAASYQLELKCQLFHDNRKTRITAAVAIFKDANVSDSKTKARTVDVLVLEKHHAASDISDAISALCSKEWDQLELVLKKIPRQSPFAEWRVFLTGCAAFHRGDKGFSTKCFSRLSAGTLPDKKANAYRVMLGDLDPLKHEESQIELGNFLGEKNIFHHVMQADRHWKNAKLHRARQALVNINGFPGFKVDMSGHLTRCFLNGLHAFNPDDICDFADTNLRFLVGKQKAGSMSLFLAIPFLRSYDDNDEFAETKQVVEKQWLLYEKNFQTFFGNSPRFRAMCQLAKAKQAIATAGMSFSYFDRGPPDLSPAITFLNRSIEIDPSFEEPHFLLLETYEAQNNDSARNKLLDVMCKRFPNSPVILKLAGQRCADRSVYKKAITYFERAEAIDPIDRETKRQLFLANLKLAITHVVKDKAHLLRPVLEILPRYSQSVSDPVLCSDEFRAVFSNTAWGVTTSAKNQEPPKLPAADSNLNIAPLRHSFYSRVAWDFIYFSNPKRHALSFTAKLPKLTKKDVAFADGVKMFKLITDQNGVAVGTETGDWLTEYLSIAIRDMKYEDFSDARILALSIANGFTILKQFGSPLAKKTKKLDPSDLFFQVFHAFIEVEFPPDLEDRIEATASIQSRDPELALLIKIYRELRERLDSPFGFPSGFDPFGFGEDEDDDDDQDAEGDEDKDRYIPNVHDDGVDLPNLPKPRRARKTAPRKKPGNQEADAEPPEDEDPLQREFDLF